MNRFLIWLRQNWSAMAIRSTFQVFFKHKIRYIDVHIWYAPRAKGKNVDSISAMQWANHREKKPNRWHWALYFDQIGHLSRFPKGAHLNIPFSKMKDWASTLGALDNTDHFRCCDWVNYHEQTHIPHCDGAASRSHQWIFYSTEDYQRWPEQPRRFSVFRGHHKYMVVLWWCSDKRWVNNSYHFHKIHMFFQS